MKLIAALVAALALVARTTDASRSQEHKRGHHHYRRHRYSVEGPRDALGAALRSAGAHLDVRGFRASGEGNGELVVVADVVATKGDVERFVGAAAVTSTHDIHLGSRVKGHVSTTPASPLKLKEYDDYDEDAVVAKDRADVAACRERTDGYLSELQQFQDDENGAMYTDNAFFECFRPADEIFAFFETLAEQNPQFVTTFANASVTYEGRAIPAFKLSTGEHGSEKKRALYTQALIHAREWQAGASTFFTFASLLDDLRAEQPHVLSLFDHFDWYFVPIVNVDGYQYSWDEDRMWRTNRHLEDANGDYVPGVDLNRNWGPSEFFNLDPKDVDYETHPGDYPLSEPSTAGLFDFIMGLDALSGVVDMHTFGGQVLRPFSDQLGGGVEPFGSQMRSLGNSVALALSTQPEVQYVSETGAYLYKAYGCFDDGMFLQFNLTVPALTIEVEGDDFVSPQSSIRPVGRNIYRGLRQFAQEALEYSDFVQDLLHGSD